MRPKSTVPARSALDLLPGATFADAFTLEVDDQNLDAISAANKVMGTVPRWVSALLKLRNAIVRPFGLKGTTHVARTTPDRIGLFPCLSRSPDRVVMGFNDSHLDFRIAVDASATAMTPKRITATTVVKTHNIFGRAYLCTIMPFHKLIVRTLLGRLSEPKSRA